MKLKTNRRLIFLLTFMLANYNVLASMSCMNGCQHEDHFACEPSANDCSDGEICSRFKIAEAYDGSSKRENMVVMQCMSIEECKTNKEATELDLATTVRNLEAFTESNLDRSK